MKMRRMCTRGAVLGLIVAAGALTGCVGYNVYPPMEGEHGFTDVNSAPFPSVITESLRWVVVRYPPSADAEWNQPAMGNVGVTPFAVNLPSGTNVLVGQTIVSNVGNGACVISPETQKLPTYHVARVWISGDEAKVDIVRPVVGLMDQSDKPITQAITVRLRGGMQPWHVTSHREWALNTLQPPETNYLVAAPTGTWSSRANAESGE